MKEYQANEILDLGAYQVEPQDDYPDYAERVGLAIKNGEAQRGILICGSGVGVCVAANKIPGIRAGMCVFMAGIALVAPWGASIAMQTHRGNPGTSVFTATQLICVAVTTMIGILAPIAWGTAGKAGFKGSKKSTPFAATVAAGTAQS